ncbi:MAG: septum formation protein Maf [Flavobacteriales bacterium]|jgi:septum formation protein|nr:septum formation protein Maf [Flavobacteriales bacterium]MBT5089952.1 septum formation protein Maf [Flavobacteriales bacterium]
MLKKLSEQYNIILGSASPRRKELLSDLGLRFNIQTTDKKETFSHSLKEEEIAEFLAKQKSEFLSQNLQQNDLLITADTIVSFKNELLNKPKNKEEAFKTLNKLSENTHKVITGVCLKSRNKEIVFSVTTIVTFKELSENEIHHYLNKYNPYDKAGAYGIQDWIGKIGINNINGSYTNVIGLPTSELYQHLKLFI